MVPLVDMTSALPPAGCAGHRCAAYRDGVAKIQRLGDLLVSGHVLVPVQAVVRIIVFQGIVSGLGGVAFHQGGPGEGHVVPQAAKASGGGGVGIIAAGVSPGCCHGAAGGDRGIHGVGAHRRHAFIGYGDGVGTGERLEKVVAERSVVFAHVNRIGGAYHRVGHPGAVGIVAARLEIIDGPPRSGSWAWDRPGNRGNRARAGPAAKQARTAMAAAKNRLSGFILHS